VNVAEGVVLVLLGWCAASVVTGLLVGRLIARNTRARTPRAGCPDLPAGVTPADHRLRELLAT